jgi:hypothetical protein
MTIKAFAFKVDSGTLTIEFRMNLCIKGLVLDHLSLIISSLIESENKRDDLFQSQEDSMKNTLLSLIKNEVGNQHATKKP